MAWGALENTDKLHYVPGQGYFSSPNVSYTDKLGQQHSGGSGIYDYNGNLISGSMMTNDGTRVSWGTNGNGFGGGKTLKSAPAGANVANVNANANAVNNGNNGYSVGRAMDYIKKWRSGYPLGENERGLLKQYFADMGYLANNVDDATFYRFMSSFSGGNTSSSSAQKSSGGSYGGGGNTTWTTVSTADPEEEKKREEKNKAAKAERNRQAKYDTWLRQQTRNIGTKFSEFAK